MTQALRRHWPEYLMEGALLGLFMASAVLFTALLEHPGSPLRGAMPSATARRVVMGLLMGSTAVALIYSRWGQRSGAHFNPSVTLTFLRLGKVAPWDALFYVTAQFAGGLLGVLAASAAARMVFAHPAVRFAATVPGPRGAGWAFAGETVISFFLMLTVLVVSNRRRIAPRTGLCAGTLVALYISVEAPLSGMSMNPARTVASALPAGAFPALWVYLTAPLLGMLLAAQAYTTLGGARAVACAKLHHDNPARCIFRCGYQGASA